MAPSQRDQHEPVAIVGMGKESHSSTARQNVEAIEQDADGLVVSTTLPNSGSSCVIRWMAGKNLTTHASLREGFIILIPGVQGASQ